jgi:cytochrome c553
MNRPLGCLRIADPSRRRHGMACAGTPQKDPNIIRPPYLVEQLKAYRSGKRAHEEMGVVAKPLTDADIAELAAWFASLEIVLKKEP